MASSPISPKVTASAAMAAASGILLWILKAYADVDPPAEVQIAIIVVLTFAAGYLKSDPLRSTGKSA